MERILKYLFPVLAFVMFAPIGANAQNGPMAPGYEKLPVEMQKLAQTPMVLTVNSANPLCLVRDDQNQYGSHVLLADCEAKWSHKIWLEPLEQNGKAEFRIRSGELACLTSPSVANDRLSFGICDDAPNQEKWTANGSQLIDFNGRCLEAISLTNNSKLSMVACNINSNNQQWAFGPMRRALGFTPTAWDPSGLGTYFNVGYRNEIIEQFRPRFSIRSLTSAERSELRSITSSWRGYKVLEVMYPNYNAPNRPRAARISIPWNTMKRLSELGETGDKDAMRAVMEAYILQYSSNNSDEFVGWDESAFTKANDSKLAWHVAVDLAKIWSAHFWQRHGPDRVAASTFSANECTKDGCSARGFRFKIAYDRPASDPVKWAMAGDNKHMFSVTDIVFEPANVWPNNPQAKFLRTLQLVDYEDKQYYRKLTDDYRLRAEWAVYAMRTGQLALFDNVMLNRNFDGNSFGSQQEYAFRKIVNDRKAAIDWRAKFEAYMNNPNPSYYMFLTIQTGLKTQSDADILRFANRHPISDGSLLPRICGNGRQATSLCLTRSREIRDRDAAHWADINARVAKANAERDAALAVQQQEQAAQQQAQAERQRRQDEWYNANRKPGFWDQVAGLAEGFAAAAEAGNQPVTVRKYDAAGNYIGSETMTRARAAGYGATPIK